MKQWLFSICLAAVLLYWLFRGIDAGALREALSSLSWPHFAGAVLCYLIGLVCRAWRYRMLLNRPLGLWPMIQITQVRNMFADLLPARIGTAVYVYLVVRRFGVDLGDALSSFFSVFLLDLAALAPLLGLGLLSLAGESQGSSLIALILPAMFILGGSAAGLAALPLFLLGLRNAAEKGQRPWLERAARTLRRIGDEYDRLRRRRVLWPAFGVSLGVRLMKYLSWYFLLLAVLQGLPGAPASLPFGRALVGTIGAELSSALPVGGIAGFGTYETAWSLSFGALGFSRELAVLSGFATHLLSQGIDYGLGILALLWLYRPPLPGALGRWIAAAILTGALLPALYGGSRLWVRLFPPATGQVTAADREQDAFRKAAAIIGRRARIVWSSNRDGDHELYALDLPESRLRKLTDDRHVDFYSRFSPDGREILFLRSRREWVSFREAGAWDAWILSLDGGPAQVVAEEVYQPSWWPDGQSIIYLRDRRLLRLDLEERRETTLADGRLPPFNGRFGTPYVSPSGDRIALTLRGDWRGVGVWEAGRNSLRRLDRADGCQPCWRPDGGGLIWVSGGGRGKNRFLQLPAGAATPSLLLDLPGDYSHEYFPRVSSDNRFLIFAAAAEGHEHDRADYEIFLWRIGSPAEEALRLTYHGGNDQWPDIRIEP